MAEMTLFCPLAIFVVALFGVMAFLATWGTMGLPKDRAVVRYRLLQAIMMLLLAIVVGGVALVLAILAR